MVLARYMDGKELTVEEMKNHNLMNNPRIREIMENVVERASNINNQTFSNSNAHEESLL